MYTIRENNMKTKQFILNFIIEHYPKCTYEVTTYNNRLWVVGYFNDLLAIKRELFNNSDFAIITKRNDGKFSLTHGI